MVGIPTNMMANVEYMAGTAPSGGVSTVNSGGNTTVVDGTPARVAAVLAFSVAVLVGLRWSGFKFNVTAGN